MEASRSGKPFLEGYLPHRVAWMIDLDRDGSKELVVMLSGFEPGYSGYLVIAPPSEEAPKPLDRDGDLVVDAVEYPNGGMKSVDWEPQKSCSTGLYRALARAVYKQCIKQTPSIASRRPI